MIDTTIYQDIAKRTGGSIYIGVVGPVRTGKSTFIKRFMESQVLSNMDNAYQRERANDELPQSGSGRTIMTAEPKFVPEEPVQLHMDGGMEFSVRMVDCVGYMVPGAVGQLEDLAPRMVHTPWFDYEIPMTEAAEIGTTKVITEHATVGIIVTTDGTITEIPREDYIDAEQRVIDELQKIGKPFVVILNSANPQGERAQSIADDLQKRCNTRCIPMNCARMDDEDFSQLMEELLYSFPLQELDVYLPGWVDALPGDHPIKSGIFKAIGEKSRELRQIRGIDDCLSAVEGQENISAATVDRINFGDGNVQVTIALPQELFYDTLTKQSGLQVRDDGDLMKLMTELSRVKCGYDKVSAALNDAMNTGYGIVMPSVEELNLEDPEIVKQGGHYGVRMKASAPSIHMIRADIETTVSPIVGNEKQSEEMVNYLLQEFEGDTSKIWQSNIFGRSFHEIVGEDLQGKLKNMPADAQAKLRRTLERIINEGGGGLICIIL